MMEEREFRITKNGPEQVVQVRLPGAARTYAYLWRGEPLELGAWVSLPGNVVSADGTTGRVDGFGRDGYRGPLKEVLARVEPQDPWMVRMKAARNRSEALAVWRDAKRAGLPAGRMAELEDAGRAAGSVR